MSQKLELCNQVESPLIGHAWGPMPNERVVSFIFFFPFLLFQALSLSVGPNSMTIFYKDETNI